MLKRRIIAIAIIVHLAITPAPAQIFAKFMAYAPGNVTYYISTTGNDSNNGLSIATAWATPNHTTNCSATGGDTILIEPGTYSTGQFGAAPDVASTWGPAGSGCASGTFRTAKCDGATLGSCKLTDGGNLHIYPLNVTTPYWRIMGLQVTCPSGFNDNGGILFAAGNAGTSLSLTGHHILLINTWVHDCQRAGVAGGDYVTLIDVLNNNTAGQSADSGEDWYEPYPLNPSDGSTHIFAAGLFQFNSIVTAGDTDGEGILFDDWVWSQKGFAQCYTNTGAITQSLIVGNSGFGFETNGNFSQSPSPSCFSFNYLTSSTLWNNIQNTASVGNGNTEVYIGALSASVSGILEIDHDIIVANKATNTQQGGGSVNVFALFGFAPAGTISNSDWVNTAVGGGSQDFGTTSGNFMTYGTGNVNASNFLGGVNPNFHNAQLVSSSLDCSSYATVTACMQGNGIIGNGATLGNFSTTNATVAGMGFQPPGACGTDAGNSLWPTWVPVALIPSGLITTPCS